MARSRADKAMERYASGDDAAFAELYDQLAPPLKTLAVRELRDAALAEDVIQQTFLNIHRARGMFTRGAEVLPWAYAIARRLATDELRRRARANRLETVAPRAVEVTGIRPDDEIVAQQTAQSLSVAFAALPELQRRVFDLRGRGLSIAEVAGSLGTTIPSVKLRLQRVGQALRAALKSTEAKP